MDKENKFDYCNSLTRYSRWETREVKIGNLPLGGENTIRVQSMTTTDTMDTKATVEQSIRMIKAGCEYVRITAPSINEAQNLKEIKDELRKRGYTTPLIADIHFTPNAAELAARIVEKVRINPGNYVDKKKFQTLEYTDAEYVEEIERIRNRFTPLVKICKEYGTAMRIGTNHGSLSDRIMSRYGDTPFGMVESALEFVRICEELNYHEIVLSMKSSNPQVMVQAYRLLIHKMKESGMNYPLHLGVTEAGEGEDGRIKSSVGIGTLLEDGIGDTIRVSLTEDPEFEIPVAKTLVDRYNHGRIHKEIRNINFEAIKFDPYIYNKRESIQVTTLGGKNVPRVIIDKSAKGVTYSDLKELGYTYIFELDKWNISDCAADFIYLGDKEISFEIPGTLRLIRCDDRWEEQEDKTKSFPMFNKYDYMDDECEKSDIMNFLMVKPTDLVQKILNKIKQDPTVVLIIDTANNHGMAEQRSMFLKLEELHIHCPVVIQRTYENLDEQSFQIYASTDAGALLLDGFGDGVLFTNISITQESNKSSKTEHTKPDFGNTILEQRKADKMVIKPNLNIHDLLVNNTAFGILQATRNRISKTEYISCPSCGRTLFDLQETTERIRRRTDHLKGLKIGIMGCIVNGPGEMADADYGYVGVGKGKVTLYKGKEVVQRSIDSDLAVDALIDLIKENGDWVERDN